MTIALRRKVLKDPERYRRAFWGPLPTEIHCYEMNTYDEGRGVGSVVIADRSAHGTLLDAFFSMARYWRETASQGWVGRGPGTPVDLEPIWRSLWSLIETGRPAGLHQIYRYEFVPMRVRDFEAALRQICQTCLVGYSPKEHPPQVVVDGVRELPDPEAFQPPVRGRYEYALAVLKEWNNRVLVAQTSEQYVFAIWNTGC